MACAIQKRAGKGTVLLYDKVSGKFNELNTYIVDGTDYKGLAYQTIRDTLCDKYSTYRDTTDGIKILVFDWFEESDRVTNGWSEAAGDALFAALMDKQNSIDLGLSSFYWAQPRDGGEQ